MSNERDYQEIMAMRAKERVEKYYDREAYNEGQEDGAHREREFIRSCCSCTCEKCGCCNG